DTIAKAHADASIAINDAAAAAARDLAAAHTKALDEIDARLEARAAALVSTIEAALAKTASPPLPPAPIDSTSNVDSEPASSESPAVEVASPPKRPRKARRDDEPTEEISAPPIPASAPSPAEIAPEESTPISVSAPTPTTTTSAEISPTPEPPPIPGETIAKIEPVAPVSASPFPITPAPDQTPAPLEEIAPPPAPVADTSLPSTPLESFPATATPSAPPNGEPSAATERSPKKRTPKKTVAPAPELPLPESAPEEFSFSSEDDAPLTSREVMERVISSDGATRLIATAYIGIGNRLFIRGDGPGLSWEKGVPLQFVSIGKWRWETPDATAPIQFKLYKNDDTECPGLGTLTLDPGHQQEVTAKF
ncbi:MAG TPA: hypothetical protein VEA63_14305, partial [Opitutus sp.]|nr:hypothetical protein [Opitutus sp.]